MWAYHSHKARMEECFSSLPTLFPYPKCSLVLGQDDIVLPVDFIAELNNFLNQYIVVTLGKLFGLSIKQYLYKSKNNPAFYSLASLCFLTFIVKTNYCCESIDSLSLSHTHIHTHTNTHSLFSDSIWREISVVRS